MDLANNGQTRSSFSSLLFLAFMIYLLSGGGEDPLTAQNRLRESLDSTINEYRNYSAWLNHTESNFTQTPLPTSLEPLVRSILPEPPVLSPSESYWKNITGFHKGVANVHNISSLSDVAWRLEAEKYVQAINLTESRENVGSWNWTSISSITMRLGTSKIDGFEDVESCRGHIDLETDNDGLKYEFHGVYLPLVGSLYARVVPDGYEPDIRQLSAMIPSQWRNATAHAVQAELKAKMDKLQHQVDINAIVPTETEGITSPACSFLMYGQLAACPMRPELLAEVEAELEKPTGASTARPPPMKIHAVMISQNCEVLFELKDVEGLRADKFWAKVTTYAGFTMAIYAGLLLLLVRQMEASRTPAAISSVSRWPFVFQGIADSFSFTSHTMFGILSKSRAALPMIATGFLACILSLMFEVRFTSLIHRIQAPEDAIALSSSAQQSSATSAGSVTAGGESRNPSRSFLTSLRRRLNAITDPDTRFWALILFLFMFIIQFTVSYPVLLTTVGVVHSFWLPQIVRNINRGTRKALTKRYVLGTSTLRSLLVLYIFACPDSIFLHETTSWVYVLVAWVAIQVLILVGQEYLGATFFIPAGWVSAPDVYDYHPVLPLPDPEAPEQSFGDCAICMEPIIVRAESGTQSESNDGTSIGASLLLSAGMRRHYAFTPCSHIMHTSCLEKWLSIKNVCPTCRTPLPPL
ncbi:hypothetical protein FRC03_006669 [Tulasnella sp. 419]|nr:hypothetical protein FRC02_011786 [Tulasnella sp. 418]KAG8970540.1 hypothetical protein FRC03_006669 [Tulasnella sp. 419]